MGFYKNCLFCSCITTQPINRLFHLLYQSVTLTKEKIKVDEAKCMQMAEIAQADLAQAMPALEAAIAALEALNKKDITEIKSYGQPPLLVRKVGYLHFKLSSVCHIIFAASLPR